MRATFAIVVPLIRPSLLYCIMLNFVLNIDQLAVPLIIGGPARVQVLSTYLYDNGIAVRADLALAASSASTKPSARFWFGQMMNQTLNAIISASHMPMPMSR